MEKFIAEAMEEYYTTLEQQALSKMQQAKESLLTHAGLSTAECDLLIDLILSGKIENVTFKPLQVPHPLSKYGR